MIIAIDGPAASGKSSVAKMLASKIYYSHFGTGIMYRAITAYAVDKNLLENLPISIIKVLDSIKISFKDKNLFKFLEKNFLNMTILLKFWRWRLTQNVKLINPTYLLAITDILPIPESLPK